MGAKGGIKKREIEYNAEVSRRIEELRVQHGLQRIELARAAGVTPQMLFAYLNGVSRWPLLRVRLIADYLGVRAERLIPETEAYEPRAVARLSKPLF